MEQYELAEKQILTELPTKYPKLFEIFVIIKMFLSAMFSTEIHDDTVYYGLVWMWIIEFAISICILIITFANYEQYSMWTAVGIVAIMQVIAGIIHMMIGHTKGSF